MISTNNTSIVVSAASLEGEGPEVRVAVLSFCDDPSMLEPIDILDPRWIHYSIPLSHVGGLISALQAVNDADLEP